MALNKYGFVPRNALTENLVQIGVFLEVVLLSLALARRINRLKEAHSDSVRDRAIAIAVASAKEVMAKQMTAAQGNKLIDESIKQVDAKLH